ncbi:MAG: NAD(P) transhydrogenase subunit alpha [Rickettsia sp.]|nr:NAD(P) transhydrogenase subunit alpha [Rickettsia sp.]
MTKFLQDIYTIYYTKIITFKNFVNFSEIFINSLTIFMLACFVGYYVVLRVSPALHASLMSITNAISGIIIIGALITNDFIKLDYNSWIGLFSIFLASINIFGGIIVTNRMVNMFKKHKKV